MKIALDLDGVLADFNRPFAGLLETLYGRAVEKTEPWPRCWDWCTEAGFSEAEVEKAFAFIHENPQWWFMLPIERGAFNEGSRIFDLVDQHEVVILTNRVSALNPSMAWVLKEFGVPIPVLPVTGPKGPVANRLGLDVIVDDKPENVISSNRVPRRILIAQPWNRGDHGEGIERTTLTEFLNSVLTPQEVA